MPYNPGEMILKEKMFYKDYLDTDPTSDTSFVLNCHDGTSVDNFVQFYFPVSSNNKMKIIFILFKLVHGHLKGNLKTCFFIFCYEHTLS